MLKLGAPGIRGRNTFYMGPSSKKAFDPASLFKNGEQGFLLDPSDLSTMFQDAAGTVPVTAVGQPLGLVLDKSKGLVMGSELIITLDLTTWATVNSPEVTKNTFTTAATGGVRLDGVLQNGTWYKCIVELDSTVGVQLYGGQQVVTLPGTGRRTITLYYEASAAGFYFRNSGAGTTTIHSLSIESIAGNHAYQTTSASRPILRKNAVTGANYLEFDGSDDFLQIANIDFSATDKMSLFTGVRKNASSVRILCELSSNMNSNSGSFYLTAPETGQGQYGFKARANANQQTSMTALTQNTSIDDICVLSASSDLSADRNTIRRNGLLSAISYDLGTGNFGNYPLFIGRRSGTSLSFNGHIYSLICVGRLTTDSETKALEKEIAKLTGVSLNV